MKGLHSSRIVSVALMASIAAACGESAPSEPTPASTEVPEDLQQSAPPPEMPGDEAAIGTPLEERVATIGLLNKRNNVSQDIELKPGETQRLGNVIIRLQSCERTAPWELPQETGAFVQVLVERADEADQFDRIFSGWIFKNSPALNVVEHPVYDVWVKDCAMSFPGEEA